MNIAHCIQYTISSCIYHYLINLPKEVSHIVMYSDCCPGQNKNGIIMAMCLYFLEIQNTLKTIEHKFMVPGHSRMECDSDHARIERTRKKYPSPINHPYDWAQLIRFAGKDKFCVLEMDQTKFFDFNTLLKKKYCIKKKNEDGAPFVFKNVKWLRYTKENKNTVMYKNSLTEDLPFMTLNMTKRISNPTFTVPTAYSGPLPITQEKKNDLMTSLCFIPDVNHDFYKSLKTSNDVCDPMISENESD